ncbi:MAG: ABC transporter substrate-binding protein [Actinomycetota bacterium]
MTRRRLFGPTVLIVALLAFLSAGCGQYEGVHGSALGAQDPTGTLGGPSTTGGSDPSGTATSPGSPIGGPGTVTGPATGPTSVAVATGPYKGEIGVTKDSITLSFIYPRGGPYQVLTTNWEPAIMSAIRTINDAGGIHGRRLVFAGCDDGYTNASQALACAKQWEGKAFGFNTAGIQSSSVIAPYANQKGVPTIVGNVDKATALKARYVFTPTTYMETEASILPSFIKNRLHKADLNIGVIYQTTPQLAVIRHHFKTAAEALGMKVVIEQPIEENPPTCVNEATNVRNATAKLVVMFSAPVAAARCLQDSRTIGFNATWTGVGATWNFTITNQASGGLTNGIEMISNTRTLESPEGQRFAAAVRKYYPNDEDAAGDDLAFVPWGQVFLWAEGLRRAGPNLTREGFIRAMETLRGWDGGIFAPLTFGPGDRSVSASTIVIKAADLRWSTIDAVWRKTY